MVTASDSGGSVWVRPRFLRGRQRGVYHWTGSCLLSGDLVEIPLAEAEGRSNLRPCTLCELGGKGRYQTNRVWVRRSRRNLGGSGATPGE